MEEVRLLFSGKLERIPPRVPPGNGKEFMEFCERYDIHPVGPGRRGWWSLARTYIQDADYVFWLDGNPLLMTGGELEEAKGEAG